jgi:hypothetical protein
MVGFGVGQILGQKHINAFLNSGGIPVQAIRTVKEYWK